MPAAPSRQIAIGDVHGCIHAFDALLEAIAPAQNDELIFLGDLVDQGANTREVVDRVVELHQLARVTLIKGNHEEMMLAARDSPDERVLRSWENCGGVATLNSYRFGARLSDIPDHHWAVLENCRPYHETADFIYTHANYLPELPMSEQPGHRLRWALFDPEDEHSHLSGKPVTVGHTEQRDGEVLDLGFATCIDTGCWRYGWLTALDRTTGTLWQASRWGILREPGEATHREPLQRLLKKTPNS
jgi:serine/threonine protein phosphatase 1